MVSIRSKKMADLMGVTPQTVRKYAEEGKIPFHTLPSGQLTFTEEDVRIITGDVHDPENPVWVFYVRSSTGDKALLSGQEEQLRAAYPEPGRVLRDSASGLNENRKGLKALLDAVQAGDVTDVAVTNRDRLSRFGVAYIERILSQNGVTLHVLNDPEAPSPEDELMRDFMSLIASFSGRFYQMRSVVNQHKLLDRAKDSLDSKRASKSGN